LRRLIKAFATGRILRHCGSHSCSRRPFSPAGHSVGRESNRARRAFSVCRAFSCPGITAPVTAVLHDIDARRPAHATFPPRSGGGVYMFATQLVGGLGPTWLARSLVFTTCSLPCKSRRRHGLRALLMLLVIHFIRRDGLRHPTLACFHAEPGD